MIAKQISDYFNPFIQSKDLLIENIQTEVQLLELNDLTLPLSINNTEYDNSYVCSPFGHFVLYPQMLLPKLNSFIARSLIHPLLSGMDSYFRFAKLNQVVQVNNWFTSTLLYPKLTQEKLSLIQSTLVSQFSDHCILFRSLNEITDQSLIQSLENLGFKKIFARKIHLTDTTDPNIFKSRMFKSDLKILAKSPYEQVPLKTSDISRIKKLYQMLYLDKHSKLSPIFTEKYFENLLIHNIFNFKGLKHNGRVDAFFSSYEKNGIYTTPMLGYDTSLPTELGLYRQLTTLAALEASQKKLIINHNGGASHYKTLRRAIPAKEYYLVYVDHLPFKLRSAWSFLQSAMNRFGTKMVDSFQ